MKIMKKIIILLVSVLCSVVVANAQESSKIDLSGNVTFLSMTNSTLTGGYFSENPALRACVSASYKNFSVSVMRNSDLGDPKSGANLFALSPSWDQTFGKYNVSVTMEFDFFDHETSMNMVAPYVSIKRKGFVDVELMAAYAAMFQGGDLNVQMLAVSKNYSGFTFKAYAWNVNWGNNKQNAALEISKSLHDNFKVSVYGHLNDFRRKASCFGAVRLVYSF